MELNEEKPLQKEIVMTIVLKPDNTLDVKGPINDKVLSYGILAMAKDAIFEHHMRLAMQPKKNGGILSFVRRI